MRPLTNCQISDEMMNMMKIKTFYYANYWQALAKFIKETSHA